MTGQWWLKGLEHGVVGSSRFGLNLDLVFVLTLPPFCLDDDNNGKTYNHPFRDAEENDTQSFGK